MKLFVAENGVQALDKVRKLEEQGISRDSIYLFAQDEERSKHLTENTDTGKMNTLDQGLFNMMANAFRSRTDELTSKLEALGVSQNEALQYENELASGRIIILAQEKEQHS
ncbi:general stress protein [Metabacillus sp. 84]|uniref:general stress protein n=1 Tax=unclassified Metabacillus TaxID=2675274 RepID=UPI003CF950BB